LCYRHTLVKVCFHREPLPARIRTLHLMVNYRSPYRQSFLQTRSLLLPFGWTKAHLFCYFIYMTNIHSVVLFLHSLSVVNLQLDGYLWCWPCSSFSFYCYFLSTFFINVYSLVCCILISVQEQILFQLLNFYKHADSAPLQCTIHHSPHLIPFGGCFPVRPVFQLEQNS
jgi:hypothetical protein